MATLKEIKIKNSERNQVFVKSTEGSRLTGTVEENKNVFDKFPQLIMDKYNQLIELLISLGVENEYEFADINSSENVYFTTDVDGNKIKVNAGIKNKSITKEKLSELLVKTLDEIANASEIARKDAAAAKLLADEALKGVIRDAYVNENGELIIETKNGEVLNLGSIKGPKGDPGEKAVTTQVGGFFTLAVDHEGNLWAYSEDDIVPQFEYNPDTGELYFISEQE